MYNEWSTLSQTPAEECPKLRKKRKQVSQRELNKRLKLEGKESFQQEKRCSELTANVDTNLVQEETENNCIKSIGVLPLTTNGDSLFYPLHLPRSGLREPQKSKTIREEKKL